MPERRDKRRMADCSRDFLVMTVAFAFATGITSINNALLMRERGLSFTALGAMVSAFFLTAAALNVPTGIAADLVGRKRLALGGYVLYGVGLFVFGAATGPAMFLLAHIIEGAGLSLWSGAFEAWYVDSLKAQGRYDECRRVFGLNASASSGVSVVAGFAAAPLIGAGMAVPFYAAGAISLAIAFYGTWRLKEPPRTAPRSSFAGTARAALRLYARTLALVIYTVGLACLELTALLFAIVWQSHLVTIGLAPEQLGYTYSLFMAVTAAASFCYAAWGARLKATRLVVGCCLAVAVVFWLAAGVTTALVAVAAMAAYHLANGLCRPAVMRWRNDLIIDYRATMISILTTVSFTFRAGFGALAGGIAELGGPPAGLLAMAVASLVAAAAFAASAAVQRRERRTGDTRSGVGIA